MILSSRCRANFNLSPSHKFSCVRVLARLLAQVALRKQVLCAHVLESCFAQVFAQVVLRKCSKQDAVQVALCKCSTQVALSKLLSVTFV